MTNNNKGFTLIEVLVALTIMSFMMVSLYTITENSLNTKDSVIHEDREFLQVYTAMHRMDLDFSQIHSPLYYSSLEQPIPGSNNQSSIDSTPDYAKNPELKKYEFIPTNYFKEATVKGHPIPIIDQVDKTTLLFMTASHRRFLSNQSQSRYAWIQYSLISDDSDKDKNLTERGEVLIRRIITEEIYDPNFDISRVKGHTLLKGIKDFSYEFYSRKKERWVETINQLEREEQGALSAIRVSFQWSDKNGNTQDFSRIFRPYWPYFDVVEDEKLRMKAKYPNSSSSGTTLQ